MRWILILILGLVPSVKASTPVLVFPDDFTWSGIFEAGLRPKHVAGLERVMVECRGQVFAISIADRGGRLYLDEGRMAIELMHDDRLRMIDYVSRVPITLQEAARRQEVFRDMVGDHLTQDGSVPVMMDPRRGSVMTGSENSVVARIGNHRLSYGFTASFQRDRPVLPTFLVTWHPIDGESHPPIRRHTVEPPEGYEWYSLDPWVHTPDPETGAEFAAPGALAARGGPAGRDRAAELLRAREPGRFMRYLWLGVGAWLLVVAGGIALWLGWRHFAGRGRA